MNFKLIDPRLKTVMFHLTSSNINSVSNQFYF